MPALEPAEVERRIPTLRLIEDPEIREETARITAEAPAYFWEVPATTNSDYHHPACRSDRGLWAHTLMLSSVLHRLFPSYRDQGIVEEHKEDHAHAAAILHDQRKNGDPDDPAEHSVPDHEILMADVVRESALPDEISAAVECHMGPWRAGPPPQTHFQQLVHQADMIASSPNISPAIHGPIPEELRGLAIEEAELS